MEKLEKFISTYENFPKAGVSFKDVIEIAQHPSVFRKLISEMAKSNIIKEAEQVLQKPVTGSNHALAWHMLRLADINDKSPNLGRLFSDF